MAGSASDIRAGGAYVELGTISDKLDKGLKEAAKKVEEFAEKVESVGKKVMAFGTAMMGPVIAAVHSFEKYNGEIKDITERTGMSAKGVAYLGYVAEETGASIESITTAARFAQRSIFEAGAGNKKSIEAFMRLGLSFDALKKMNPDDQFMAIAKAIGQVKDPTQQVALAQQLFGRGAQALLPMLRMSAEEWAILKTRQEALRPVTEENCNLAEQLGRVWTDLMYGLGGISDVIGSTVGPALRDFENKIAGLLVIGRKWLDSHREMIWTYLKMAAAVFATGAAIFGFGAIISALATTIGVLGSVFAAVSALLSPVFLWVMAITLGLVLLAEQFGIMDIGAGAALANIGKRFLKFFTDIRIGTQSIGGYFSLAVIEIVTGLEIAAITMSGIWETVKTDALNAAVWIEDQFLRIFDGLRSTLRDLLIAAAGDNPTDFAKAMIDSLAPTDRTGREKEKKDREAEAAWNELLRTQDINAASARGDAAKKEIRSRDQKPGAVDQAIQDLTGVLPQDMIERLKKMWADIPTLEMTDPGKPGVPGTGGEAFSKVSTIGTFSAIGAAGLASSSSANSQLQEAKTQTEVLKQISKNTEAKPFGLFA